MSLIFEFRRLSTTSRFSSPGTPKTRSTPSFSSARTSRSDPLSIVGRPPSLNADAADDRLAELLRGGRAAEVAGAHVFPVERRTDCAAQPPCLVDVPDVI